jgi:hypothetical protein
MEKTAIIGSALYGGLSLMTLSDKNKELQNIAKINPMQRDRDAELKLKPSYTYQFEGGKNTGMAPAAVPHRV